MSASLHEKIQLSTDDIKYLQRQFLSNAHSKLKLNLPSSSQDTKDPLTLKIVNLVQGFIYEMFEMSRHSLIIDGKDMSAVNNLKDLLTEPKEHIEAFDVEINARLRKLYQEVEQETLEVTELRRRVPEEVQRQYREALDAFPPVPEVEDVEDEEINIDDVLPRLEEMINDYNETLKDMDVLKQNLPERASQVEKLTQLMKFVENVSQK